MKTDEQFLITLNRELGSGGRSIGREVAARLGVRFYDKFLLESLVKEFHLDADEIEKLKGQKKGWWAEFCDRISRTPAEGLTHSGAPLCPEEITSDDLYRAESRILGQIASEESCVVAGRTAFHILRDHPNKIRVFIRASMDRRIERVMSRQGLSEEEAAAVIQKVDEGRENYVRRYTGTSRYDARNYDLVLNVDNLTVEQAVRLIMDYIKDCEK